MRHLILTGALLAGCSGCNQPQLPPRPPLVFASLNLGGGFSAAFRTPEMHARQATFVLALGADILALQECEGDAAAAVTPPGGTLVGEGEVMLWIRPGLEMVTEETIPLDYGAWVDGQFITDTNPRTTVYAVVRDGDRDISIAAVHLTASAVLADGKTPTDPAPIRAVQLAESAGFDPDVIMGDFNAVDDDTDSVGGHEIKKALSPLGYRAATHGEPDAIWWKLEGAGKMVLTHDASDHPSAAWAKTK